MQGAMVAKREELARFINLIASDWDTQQKAEGGGPQQSTKVGKLIVPLLLLLLSLICLFQVMWKVHLIWLMIGCVCPVSTLFIMNYLWPTKSVFVSSVFCDSDDGCPVYIVILSAMEQNFFMTYCYFGILIFDVLPTACAVYARRSMKVKKAVKV